MAARGKRAVRAVPGATLDRPGDVSAPSSRSLVARSGVRMRSVAGMVGPVR